MNAIVTRPILVGSHVVELWESPDAPFESTLPAIRHYAASGAWVALFNALMLHVGAVRAE